MTGVLMMGVSPIKTKKDGTLEMNGRDRVSRPKRE